MDHVPSAEEKRSREWVIMQSTGNSVMEKIDFSAIFMQNQRLKKNLVGGFWA